MRSGMNIKPDFTIVIQFVFFAASYWVLTKLFFPPVLNIIFRRYKMIENAKKELKEHEEKGLEMQSTYENRIREVRIQAQDIRKNARQEANQKERNLLEEAREKASVYLKGKELDFQKQQEEHQSQVEKNVGKLSEQIVEKLLKNRIS